MATPTMLQRLLKAASDIGFWRGFGRLHAAVYRATDGLVGGSAGRLTNLLLTTTGRKSGERRTVPLAYVADGERFVVVASNGGADRHPAWWLNLLANPRATVQVRHLTVDVTAREATPVEHTRLWPHLKSVNPFFAQYERMTGRRIPVVVLERVRR